MHALRFTTQLSIVCSAPHLAKVYGLVSLLQWNGYIIEMSGSFSPFITCTLASFPGLRPSFTAHQVLVTISVPSEIVKYGGGGDKNQQTRSAIGSSLRQKWVDFFLSMQVIAL